MAVRDGLSGLFALRETSSLGDDLRGLTEIVLAEVLNNVVEHAYAGTSGPIAVVLDHRKGALHVTVRDEGVALPDGRLPDGSLPDLDGDGLPEGGFGWHLIRSLVTDLRYCRDGGANHLAFTMLPGGVV